MRGERRISGCSRCRTVGSSPHARGTLSAMRGPAAAARLIPACAGNAPFGGSPTGEKAVHPRMRGERTGAARGNVIAGGSSPHARGTPATEPVALRNNRFIPACAGNARGREGAVIGNTVHPRMRGERRCQLRHAQPPPGSSPHARGTHAACRIRPGVRRFIPACAGNAISALTETMPGAVHPRMRGERQARRRHNVPPDGSSPHARGTPVCAPSSWRSRRFIPACAGNACTIRQSAPIPSVHPRMRGERCRCIEKTVVECGSSPHARGTHLESQ